MLTINYRVDCRKISHIAKLVNAGRYVIADTDISAADTETVLSNGLHILHPVSATEDADGIVTITPNAAFLALYSAYYGDNIYLSDKAGDSEYVIVITK